jgi:hypothetical protein
MTGIGEISTTDPEYYLQVDAVDLHAAAGRGERTYRAANRLKTTKKKKASIVALGDNTSVVA